MRNENCPTIGLENDLHKNIKEYATKRYDIMDDLKHYKNQKAIYDTHNLSHAISL